jgi:hypothetical protein
MQFITGQTMALQTHTSQRITGKLLEYSARGIFSAILTEQQLKGDLASMVKACVHETGKQIPGLADWLSTDSDKEDGLWNQLQEKFNHIPITGDTVVEMLKVAIQGDVVLQGMAGHTISSAQQKAIINAVIDTLTYANNDSSNNPHQVRQVNIKEVKLKNLLSYAMNRNNLEIAKYVLETFQAKNYPISLEEVTEINNMGKRILEQNKYKKIPIGMKHVGEMQEILKKMQQTTKQQNQTNNPAKSHKR